MKNLNLMEKWSNKRGGSTVIEILVSITLITFFLFYPLATFSLNQKQNLLEDVLTTSMQMVSVEGGLTDRVEELIYLNLEGKGLLPEGSYNDLDIRDKVIIESNADARDGKNHLLKNRDGEDPKIALAIWYPADKEVRFLNGITKLIGRSNELESLNNGSGVNWHYKLQGYTLSEKIQ